MTDYKRGDVVLVPFPFSDQTATKKRPSVVISSDKYNQISSDIIIMAITSKIEQIPDIGEYKIEAWQTAGLMKPSIVKSAISTIELRLILKKMGSLSQKDLVSLEKALRELLDI